MTDSAVPLFTICNAASAVTTIFKAGGVLRIFPAGVAAQDQPLPYATFVTVGGHVENSMDSASRADNERIQVDVWFDEASGRDAAVAGARAIRTALEDSTAQSGQGVAIRTLTPIQSDRDAETRRWRASFDISFWTTA